MTPPLSAYLFGQPRFSMAEAPVTCASKKALALFVFLLLSGRTHSRREIAALLWGRRDDETARASLRAALHRLPAAMADCLQVERESVRFAAAIAPLVDVGRFEALSRGDDLDSLETAATLYQDELLKDFEPDATPEFDDWLHAERTRLAQLAQTVFDGVIARRAKLARLDAARATTERESALATALRWVSLMPGAEAAHRWLMQIYIEMGRRDAALAQYELCQRFLAVTYGRAPSRETRELQEAALGASASAPDAFRSTDAPTDAPSVASALERVAVATTSFVGRLAELAELDQLLNEPSCRLITIHGLGGAGKTRLAHALASQVGPRFAQGICWVALDAVQSSDALPAAIASALGRDLPPQGDRAAAVAGMLARQQRLLVLDNFESLLTGAPDSADAEPIAVVLKILHAAPQVRIVITSREVLRLQEEWIYEVRGLACAPGESAAMANSVAPAVELFAQRARQAYLGFSLSAEMPHVLRICNLVEGLPLGIELAAAWVRTIPCGEIAAAIEREAATLRSTHRNRPERQRNLEAVVAYSWNLLGVEQQNALAGLGLFVGGFTREAAERVAETPLRTLSLLVDKALVRRASEGRYGLHELVRQFALARLQRMRARAPAVGKRHTEFFAALLIQIFTDTRGPDEIAADALFRVELANVLAGWRRSIESRRLEIVEQMAVALIALLHTRGMLRVALTEAERAFGVLEASGRDDVVAMFRLQWGRAATTGGQPEVGRRELDAALNLARAGGKPDTIVRCIYYLGALKYQQGNLDDAEKLADEALALGANSDDPEIRALVHNFCGTLANMRSRFDVAEHHLRQGLAAAREQGSLSFIGGLLCSLNVPLYYQGKFAEGAALSVEAANLYERLGRNTIATMVRSNLSATFLAQGDFPAAQVQAEIAVRLSRESGDDNMLSGSLANLADSLLQQDRAKDARSVAEEALRVTDIVPNPLHATEALYLLTVIELRERRSDVALVHILRLRDILAEHRLDVRVPMLILAVAEWAVAVDDANWPVARRWMRGLCRLGDIDATLRDKGRRLLTRQAETTGDAEQSDAVSISLPELEAEVIALLAHAWRSPTG